MHDVDSAPLLMANSLRRRRPPLPQRLEDGGPLENRWLWLLLLAIVAHLFLAKVPMERFTLVSPATPTQEPVAVELASKRRPVVMTERAPVDPVRDDKKPADYAGEFRNRTDRETKAQQNGAFREFRQGGTAGGKTAQPDAKRMPNFRGNGDVETSRIRSLGMQDLMPQSAASPNHLPDSMAAGVRTVLNTDSVIGASFLNRIASAVYDTWVANARQAAERLNVEGKILESNVYITRLYIEIDNDGNLRDVRITASSGVPLLDDAPKRAFWDVQPFRNPPKAMFKNEPTVQIPYEFYFDWRRSGGVSLPFGN